MTRERDYIVNIDSETGGKILDTAYELDLFTETFTGCLLDNHVIYNAKRIKIGNAKPREYMLITEVYLNEWSSGYELRLTNDKEKVEAFVDKMEKESNCDED